MPTPKKPPALEGGLRARKKLSTRRAIEQAASALFAEHGYEETTLEQIAERAEVSPATFFRYFRGKSDLVVSDLGSRLPLLMDAFLSRPASESDLEAARVIFTKRGDAVDMANMQRLGQTYWSQPTLDEARFKILREWTSGLSETLAARRGLSMPDSECLLMSRVIFSVVGSALEEWTRTENHPEHISVLIERNFRTLERLGGEWVRETKVKTLKIVKPAPKKRKTG